MSVANRDKRHAIFPVKRLADLGFKIAATAGTAQVLRRHGVDVTVYRKEHQGPGADGTKTVVQGILDSEIDIIFNEPDASPAGKRAAPPAAVASRSRVGSIPARNGFLQLLNIRGGRSRRFIADGRDFLMVLAGPRPRTPRPATGGDATETRSFEYSSAIRNVRDGSSNRM